MLDITAETKKVREDMEKARICADRGRVSDHPGVHDQKE